MTVGFFHTNIIFSHKYGFVNLCHMFQIYNYRQVFSLIQENRLDN